jgi:hypothetical protein
MTDKKSQDIDLHTTESGFTYHRGSALSIFKSDRMEDFIALACALIIAFGVYFFIR